MELASEENKVKAVLNIFNHQTNEDVDNHFTVYGIRDLGMELSPITMLVMMESIQNRIIANGKTIEKGTDLYNLYNTNIHEKIAMEKRREAILSVSSD